MIARLAATAVVSTFAVGVLGTSAVAASIGYAYGRNRQQKLADCRALVALLPTLVITAQEGTERVAERITRDIEEAP